MVTRLLEVLIWEELDSIWPDHSCCSEVHPCKMIGSSHMLTKLVVWSIFHKA